MKKLSTLEYRLNDETNEYPAIYQYHNLNNSEIYCRRICDYYIKNGHIFRKTSTLLEADKYVIYVEEDFEEELFDLTPVYKQITLEIRYCEEDSPLLYTYDLKSHEDAFSFMGSDYLQIGKNEYEIMATEIDEDRSTYVLYVTETGYAFE
nr:hypothetical protein [uncultured Bacillus sp.]